MRARAAGTVRTMAVLAAALTLGSCQVFQFLFSSVFPGTIALARAQADLSGKISANDGYGFRLRAVQSGGNGYVIVVGSTASGGNTAYVYDSDLGLKATLTGLTGDGVMVDAGGYIVIGTDEYDPATLAKGTSISNTLSSYGNECGEDGFNNGSGQEIINLSVSGTGMLNWGLSGYPWGGAAAGSSITALSATVTSLRVSGVLDDGNPSGNITLAVAQVSNNNNGGTTCWFLTTPKANFPLVTIPSYWLDSSPHLDNIATGSLGFAQGSILAYDTSAGRFLRIDPATGSTQGSFYVGADLSAVRFAFPVSGSFFYGFDTKTRVLTKYAQWW